MVPAIENIAKPAKNDVIDLCCLVNSTSSNKELIFGIMKGATMLADSTAKIASFFRIFFEADVNPVRYFVGIWDLLDISHISNS